MKMSSSNDKKKRKPLIVGLTGGFATGKTTVALMLAQWGAQVVDTDKIVHRLIQPKGKCFQPIVRVFGKEVLAGREIDKGKLAEIVFGDERKRKTLENIIHPQVVRELQNRIARFRKQKRPGILVLEVPLLFEVGLDRKMDVVIVVRARQHDQVVRALHGRFKNKRDVVQRIKAQMPLAEKMRHGDIVVDNRGSLADTRRQVGQVWQDLQHCSGQLMVHIDKTQISNHSK